MICPAALMRCYGQTSMTTSYVMICSSCLCGTAMLLRYAREHHFPNPTFFVDDGVSGVTYDRPGFQAMLAEIEAERVAVCITKDYCAIIGLNQKDLENQGILA